MAINLSGSYINNTSNGTGSISAPASNNGYQINASGQELANVKSGETISGEITSIDGNNVTLKLANGTEVNAKLQGNIDLAIGRTISFQVAKGADQSALTLRPLYSNLNNTSVLSSALKAAGLAQTNTNLLMTQAMMEEGMSVNKNALGQMARDVNAYPNVDPKSIVQMTKLGLQIDEITVSQFENYKNFEHQIINDVNSLSDEVSNLIKESLNGNATSTSLSSDLLSLIDTSRIVDDFADETPANIPANLSEQINIAESISNENVPVANSEPAPIVNSMANLSEANHETDEVAAKDTGKSHFDELLNIMGKSPDIKEGAAGTVDILKEAFELLNNPKESNLHAIIKEKLNALLDNAQVKADISKAISSQLTISPESISKDGEVSSLYERIKNISSKVIEMATANGKDNPNVLNSAQNLQNNVDFMQQLNHVLNYVQLPLKMYQENAHGELYVYSKAKSISENDGNLNALLHLDMEHLGPMDIYVSMKNYTNVSTNFRLSSVEVLDLIEENIELLNDRLKAKGYNVDFNVTTGGSITGKDNPITDEFMKNSPDEEVRTISKFKFDVRA